MPPPASQDADTGVLSSPSLSTASNDTRSKERVEASPTKETGGAKTLATTLHTIHHTTQPNEKALRQEKSPDAVMNNEGDCPSSCPSNVTDRPSAPTSSGGRRRRWKQEPPLPGWNQWSIVAQWAAGTGRAICPIGYMESCKSKTASPYHLLQSITERLTSIPNRKHPTLALESSRVVILVLRVSQKSPLQCRSKQIRACQMVTPMREQQ